MIDVFISYSRTNEDVVARLAEAVKQEGYSVWWDAELPPHLSYGDVITEKIGAAKAAIVVWSRKAAASEWVRAEADVARNQKKLIQVSVDDAMPPLPFNQIQFASIGDWNGEADHPGWRKVRASLAALCGPRPGGEEAAAPAPAVPRRAPPPRDPAPTPFAAPPPPGRGMGLVAGLLAMLVILVGAGVYLLLVRDGGGERRDVARTDPAPAKAVAADRSEGPAPAVRRDDPAPATEPPQLLPDSSSRPLDEADLAGLSADQLRLARNEIYARNGRVFRDPALRRHFQRFRWYRPRSAEVRLSPLEQANVRVIEAAEAEKR